MQQASRISDNTAFFYMGDLIEFDSTNNIFTNPKEEKNRKNYNWKVWIKNKNMNTIEKEIQELRKSLLQMFFLVESQWEKGSNAILEYDQDIAEEISHQKKRINAQELKIDSECENLIALHAPVAVDLRFILTTFKINHALEHIADIVESIATYVANYDVPYEKSYRRIKYFRYARSI